MRIASTLSMLLLIGLGLALAGCAGAPDYSEVQASLRPVAPDQARLVFFRASLYYGSAISYEVAIDGKDTALLPSGTVVIVDRAPGNAHIRVRTSGLLAFNMITGTHVDLTVPLKPARTYYIELGTYLGSCDQVMFGPLGCAETALLASKSNMSATDHCSTGQEIICAALRDASVALPRLADLTVEKPQGE
jgi:hypothetical protein